MSQLTKEQEEKYVKHSGEYCPFCGAGNIEGESVDISAGMAYQNCTCTECNESWTDEYTLSGISEVE